MDEFYAWFSMNFPGRPCRERIAAHAAWLEAARRADRKAREEIIDLIEKYKVPVGNSAAGELACEFTMDALADIRDAIRATIED